MKRHLNILTLALYLLLVGCGVQTVQRTITKPLYVGTIDGQSPFLKAHMRNGDVYVLNDWKVISGARTVTGQGTELNAYRQSIRSGQFTLSIDSVAIFETNRVQTSRTIAPLSLITGVSVGLTAYCAVNPKACFGSCPTFYTTDGNRATLQAEGFSGSISPVLEARDIDALYRAHPTGRRFELTMKNEALETHVVRYADLLAAPKPPGGRVLATPDGEFYQVRRLQPPDRCTGPEGDCTPQLLAFDGQERYTPADPTDLAAKETIDIRFTHVPNGPLGLAVASRQTLMSTYVFYQGLSYLGHSAGTWLSSLENKDPAVWKAFRDLGHLFGGIEIQMQTRTGEWLTVSEITELGPLATDMRVLPLPRVQTDTLTVRLRLATGHWRLDQIALVALGNRVRPVRCHPVLVHRRGVPDPEAKEALCDASQTLATLPGDAYVLTYELPQNFDHCELFLESRGYYLEWMRREWMAEENAAKALQMMVDPAGALRAMAPAFKVVEAEMEPIFWSSCYAHGSPDADR